MYEGSDFLRVAVTAAETQSQPVIPLAGDVVKDLG